MASIDLFGWSLALTRRQRHGEPAFAEEHAELEIDDHLEPTSCAHGPLPLLLVVLFLCSYLFPIVFAHLRGRANLRRRYPTPGGWAMVTGGSRGFGLALADSLASQGFHVVIVARDDEYLQQAFETLRRRHPRMDFRMVGCDLTRDDANEYMAYIDAATRDIDVPLVFLSASVHAPGGQFHATPLSDHLACISCNAISSCRIAHHFLPHMYASNQPGLLCFFSSAAAFMPSPSDALYAATRAFSSHLAASLAAEALPHGVDVVAMHPHDGDPPEFVLRRTLRHIGCGQVLADLGLLSVLMRLATKLVDTNVLALTVLPVASRLSSVTRAWDWLRTRSQQREGA